jgi:hypothetical protein
VSPISPLISSIRDQKQKRKKSYSIMFEMQRRKICTETYLEILDQSIRRLVSALNARVLSQEQADSVDIWPTVD